MNIIWKWLFDREYNRESYLKGIEAAKVVIAETSSKHWTEGGTGVTNISLSNMDTYKAVIKEFGNPNIFVIDKPMIKEGAYFGAMGSLHDLNRGNGSMSAFWCVYDKYKGSL